MKRGNSKVRTPSRAGGAEPAETTSAAVKDKEFMLTLAKGLAVLDSFGRSRPTMTLSQAAEAVDLSRATARRVLHTLVGLGYVEQTGRQFALSPRIMRLGFAYISSQSWVDHAVPLMKTLSARFHETCSASCARFFCPSSGAWRSKYRRCCPDPSRTARFWSCLSLRF
jgi:predicted transcriptional regulator